MPSGYEKSPDYGGPEPNLKLWLLLAVAAAVIAAIYLFARFA